MTGIGKWENGKQREKGKGKEWSDSWIVENIKKRSFTLGVSKKVLRVNFPGIIHTVLAMVSGENYTKAIKIAGMSRLVHFSSFLYTETTQTSRKGLCSDTMSRWTICFKKRKSKHMMTWM